MSNDAATEHTPSSSGAGVLYGGGAFLIWGLLPAFWKLLQAVPALEILCHRVLWSALFGALLISYKRRWKEIPQILHSGRTMAALSASTLIIGSNWLIFIWAVNNGYLLETSLGYFINPLLNVLLGILFLQERLSRLQGLSVLLAGLAVLYLTLDYGEFPWVSMALALTFAFYGLVRKKAPVGALMGLGLETFLLTLPAAAYLGWLEWTGAGAFGGGGGLAWLLAAAGPATFIPLLFFNEGAKRLPLSTLGLLQYLGPTLHFLLAVFAYDEEFTRSHLITFTLIWTALALFSIEMLRRERSRRRALRAIPPGKL
ncbi:MAG TPA: EamA family transporter RarD [Acidobacteriota bacterium]|nr:EamA family transporter RarD [Acidobacteriota bacterium]